MIFHFISSKFYFLLTKNRCALETCEKEIANIGENPQLWLKIMLKSISYINLIQSYQSFTSTPLPSISVPPPQRTSEAAIPLAPHPSCLSHHTNNMLTFTAPLFLQPSRRSLPISLRRYQNRLQSKATLPPPDDQPRVRFNRDPDPSTQPKRSFFPTPPPSDTLPTPNERVLSQVRETMRKLGIEENDKTAPIPPSFTPINISHVNPLGAFVGAGAAAFISYIAWLTLGYTVNFFVTHPLTDQIYIVQRISAVVRTVLVCLFALGSGISGVTALGLFLLGIRTTAAAITGEFRNNNTTDST